MSRGKRSDNAIKRMQAPCSDALLCQACLSVPARMSDSPVRVKVCDPGPRLAVGCYCCGQARAGKVTPPPRNCASPAQQVGCGSDLATQFLRPGKKLRQRQGHAGPVWASTLHKQLPLRQTKEKNFTSIRLPFEPASPSFLSHFFISIAELPCKFSSFVLSSSLTFLFGFYTNSSPILVCIPTIPTYHHQYQSRWRPTIRWTLRLLSRSSRAWITPSSTTSTGTNIFSV